MAGVALMEISQDRVFMKRILLTIMAVATLTIATVVLAIAENNPEFQQTPTPSPSPAQPTVIIYNNITTTTQTQQVTPTVVIPQAPVVVERPAAQDSDFILTVWKHYSNYDRDFFNTVVQDGVTNWFGHSRAHMNWILEDMSKDARRYTAWNSTYFPGTFWREVFNEYSVNWQGPMIYDHIEMISNVYENGVRWHRAHVRFTVGYTYVGEQLKIYAMIYQVL